MWEVDEFALCIEDNSKGEGQFGQIKGGDGADVVNKGASHPARPCPRPPPTVCEDGVRYLSLGEKSRLFGDSAHARKGKCRG